MREPILPPNLGDMLRRIDRRLARLERSPRYFTTDEATSAAPPAPLVESAIATFGIQADTVATKQSRTSATYGDLSTAGPAVTVDVSNTGNLLVIAGCQIEVNINKAGAMSVALSGANTEAADDANAFLVSIIVDPTPSESSTVNVGGAKPMLFTGLSAGSTTVTAKYRGDGVVAADFEDRLVIAIPF